MLPKLLLGFVIDGLIFFKMLGLYMIFQKAGEKGWKAVVPFLDIYTLFKIVDMNPLWIISLIVPFLNIVVLTFAYYKLATHFGHGAGYTVGMLLLNPLFFSLIGLSKDKFN